MQDDRYTVIVFFEDGGANVRLCSREEVEEDINREAHERGEPPRFLTVADFPSVIAGRASGWLIFKGEPVQPSIVRYVERMALPK